MAALSWEPQGGEVRVLFDPVERSRYEAAQPSAFDQWAWPTNLIKGRDRRNSRCFPEVAARAHFEQQGYKVLMSAPKYPDDLGYPDLFVFRPDTRERFFVEAKAQDSLNCNQLVCFRLIEQHLDCTVRVVRLVPLSNREDR